MLKRNKYDTCASFNADRFYLRNISPIGFQDIFLVPFAVSYPNEINYSIDIALRCTEMYISNTTRDGCLMRFVFKLMVRRSVLYACNNLSNEVPEPNLSKMIKQQISVFIRSYYRYNVLRSSIV